MKTEYKVIDLVLHESEELKNGEIKWVPCADVYRVIGHVLHEPEVLENGEVKWIPCVWVKSKTTGVPPPWDAVRHMIKEYWPAPCDAPLSNNEKLMHDASYQMLREYEELKRAAEYVLASVNDQQWALDHLRHALGLRGEK